MDPVGDRRARYGMLALLACGGGAVVFSPGWAPLWVALGAGDDRLAVVGGVACREGDGTAGGGRLGDAGGGSGARGAGRCVGRLAGLGAGGRGILGLPLGAGDPGGADLGLECAYAGGWGVGALDGAPGPRLPDPLAGGAGHGPGRRGAGPVAAGLALDVVLRAPGRRRGDELRADAVWPGGGMAGARVYARVCGPDAGRVVEGDSGTGLVGRPLDPGGRDLDGPMAFEARGDGQGRRRAWRRRGSGSATTGEWSGRSGSRSGSTARPRRCNGRSDWAGTASCRPPASRPRPGRTSPRVPRRPCAASCGGSPTRPGSKRRSIGPALALENFRASADDGYSRRVRSGTDVRRGGGGEWSAVRGTPAPHWSYWRPWRSSRRSIS